ncbi:hypothetical protein [Geobacillus sp. PA-3]|uniref:hypothetical protein n=1 Tax=Geobacillus sp. PA-3 TaxID=1699078 RepID=UPI000760C27A|nr:hypothetical protein [Geobacillus sp. PA-3]
MQEKGKKKLLTKNEIIYIISANSTEVRVVFGNNEPKNEEMKEPLVASGFALIERNARFHNRLKIVWDFSRVGSTPTIGTENREKVLGTRDFTFVKSLVFYLPNTI